MTPEDRDRRLVPLPPSRKRLNAALDEEMRFHLEERIEQFVATGMSRADAESEVRRRFGDIERHRREAREIDAAALRHARTFGWLQALLSETRRALRALRRSPSFSVVAVLTLALGIGAATAMFTVLDRVVLRPLPYPEPERLVSVLHPATVPGSGERKWGLSPGGYFHFKANAKTLEQLGLYVVGGATITGDGEAEVVDVAVASATVFDVLRAKPALGRLFDANDDLPDSLRVVVLGWNLWQRRFGGDPGVIGRTLQTTDGSYQIIGVAQPALTLPIPGPFSDAASLNGVDLDLWMPIKLNPAGPFWNNHPYVGIGRLRAGATPADAHREVSELTRQLPAAVPNAYSDKFLEQYNFRGEAAPLRDSVLGPTLPRTLWMLFAAVLLVLSVAAANVANLFLVRFEGRRREVAVRTALGAARRHLAIHYLAESLALCAVAAVLGIGLAYAALKGVLLLAPADTPRLTSVALSPSSAAFALAAAFGAAIVFGLMPVLRPGAGSMVAVDEGRTATQGRARRRSRNALVVGQLAIAVVLLAAAGLLLKSIARLRAVRPGFSTERVLAFNVSLPWTQYDTREKALVFYREFFNRLSAVPGVEAVGAASSVPLEAGFGTGCSVVWREGRPYAKGEATPCVATPVALPGFLETLSIQVRGHRPDWGDVDGRTQGVVVTQALANRLWPGEDPIGQGINTNGPDSKDWYRIVGVIPELRGEAIDRPASEAVLYAPTGFTPGARSDAINGMTMLVRVSAGSPLALSPTIRRILGEMDSRVPFVAARTMDQVRSRSLARTSFLTTMLGIAAAVALLLSVVGTYGVVSYVVSQRRAELGVRLALGAHGSQLSRMVVGEAMRLGMVGTALGVAIALGTNRLLASVLYGVRPSDPWAMVGSAVVLVAFAALAAVGPARRAGRTAPADVLRG